jgi:hypothetical protein
MGTGRYRRTVRPAAMTQVYLDTLQGRIPPEQGHMLSLP